MNKYDRRWQSVLKFARRLGQLLKDNPNFKLVYEGEIYDNMQILIEEDRQRITLEPFENKCISYLVYSGNLDCDEGAYDTVAETKARLKETFQVVEIRQVKI